MASIQTKQHKAKFRLSQQLYRNLNAMKITADWSLIIGALKTYPNKAFDHQIAADAFTLFWSSTGGNDEPSNAEQLDKGRKEGSLLTNKHGRKQCRFNEEGNAFICSTCVI